MRPHYIGGLRARWIGIGNLGGAGAAVLLTPMMWLVYHTNARDAEGAVRLVVGTALVLLCFHATRTVGVGFFMGIAALTVVTGGQATGIWWRELNVPIGRVTSPFTRWFKARSEQQTWIAHRRGRPLDLKDALMLASNLNSGCVPSYTRPPGTPLPASLAEIMQRQDCDRFKPSLFDDDSGWPQRYFASDTGWRWQYSSVAAPDGTTGYRLTLRPDRRLDVPGPILDITEDGWYLVREPSAISRMS